MSNSVFVDIFKNVDIGDLVLKYFPDLDDSIIDLFKDLESIYFEWNYKINLVSRRDIMNFGIKHLIHSLVISKIVCFKNSTTVLDVGTGGGLPGLPLAILYPNTQFTLLDSISKKIRVVNDIIFRLGIKNVITVNSRVELFNNKYDFVIGRGVANFFDFFSLCYKNISHASFNDINNGVLYLGGVPNEIETLPRKFILDEYDINSLLKEEMFIGKKIFHVHGNIPV